MPAPTFSLGFDPIWYFVDQVGKPLGAGYLVTQSSFNPTVLQPVFTDPNGNFPYPYVDIPNLEIPLTGILIGENGTINGPIYFTDNVFYFLQAYDFKGVLIWTVQFYLSPGSGSGGGGVTEGINSTNLIVNNTFWRGNVGTFMPGTADVLIAPGAHSNFGQTPAINNQADIRFLKGNTSATDSLELLPLLPAGSNPFQGGNDVTPPIYLNYTCSLAGASEGFKYVQFPISNDLQSTSGQSVFTSIWAKCNSGNNQLTLQYKQFYGDGTGSSGAIFSTGQTFTLNSTWTKYSVRDVIPSISTGTEGACHNEGLYLTVQLPLNTQTSIDFVKASGYLAAFPPNFEYLTNDQIDAVINAPRTGDVRVSLNSFAPYGWVPCNDGVIGDPASNSAASPNGGRADYDTFPLFDLIWQAFNANQALAPMFTNTHTPIVYGASSIIDFEAHNQISLTKQMGRAISSVGIPSTGGTGNNWPLGTAQGEELHVLSIPEIPSHTHPPSSPNGTGYFESISGGTGNLGVSPGTNNMFFAQTGATGGNAGHNTIQPTAYYNVFLKL